MNRIFLLAIGLMALRSLPAQTLHSGWVAGFYTIDLTQKAGLIGDVQFRSGNEFSQMQTLLLRGGFQYKFSSRLAGSAGYAYILHRRAISEVSGYGPENRLWEQLIVSQKIGFVPLTHRFRLEQRFISKSYVEEGSLKNDGHVYSNRFRYFVRAIAPFSGEKNFSRGIFGALQDEVMLQFGDKSGVNGKSFDQNRFYVALGYRFSRKFDLEAGYMNQYVEGRGSAFANNHILQLAGYFRL